MSLHYKFEQYDRYLTSMRYAQKYKDFGYFTLLFVNFGEERVQNIRVEMRDLSSELADYCRLTTCTRLTCPMLT